MDATAMHASCAENNIVDSILWDSTKKSMWNLKSFFELEAGVIISTLGYHAI